MTTVAAAQSNAAELAHTNATAKAEGAKQIIAERFKSKMCRSYVKTGTCPYEHRCMFAHGTHELRTKAMNIADNITTEEAVKLFQRKVRSQQYAPQQPVKPAPPAYSTYMAPKMTSSMGVLAEDVDDEVSNSSSGEYNSQYYSGSSYPVSRASNYGSYTNANAMEYADYEGPCQCDDCLRAAQMPCQCAECAAAAAAAVCPCDECNAARQQLSSCGSSSCATSENGARP